MLDIEEVEDSTVKLKTFKICSLTRATSGRGENSCCKLPDLLDLFRRQHIS
jgi:hypothetical protein